MVLWVNEKWEAFFIASNIPADTTSTYVITFAITEDVLPDLTKETLHELGIDVISNIFTIIKHAKQWLSIT